MCSAKRIFSMTPMLALLAVVAFPAAAQSEPPVATASDQIQSGPLDPRWLPWLGCWELTGDAVDYRQIESTGRRVVCVAPRLDGLGVNLTTQLDNEIIAQNTVVADGRDRGLAEDDCSGEQSASWSANGRRLHSFVSAECAGDTTRSLMGLSMLSDPERWVELQSVSFDGGEHRELVVRQYARLGDAATAELGYQTLATPLAVQAATARAAAAGPFTVDDVLEASDVFPVEIVEAAVLETDSMFALNGDALIRLADAGVEERVIDLMVAISFPDRFIVDSGRSGGGGGGGSVYGGTYVGFGGFVGYYPSCWGRYYSPFWGPYGPGCDRYFYSPYYGGGYRPPYYGPGGGYISPRVPPSGSLYGGKVVKNRGYATVSPRPEPLPSSGGGIGGAIRRAVSRDGGIFGDNIGGSGRRSNSGGSSGVTSSGSGNTRSSVSKSGFTRSGGSSGGASRSGGGKAKAKAKAKVGGGRGGGG